MKNKETIITGAILILITYTLGLSLVSQAFPAQQTIRRLTSAGTIQIPSTLEIGIYSDAQCSTPLTSLNWGALQPGGSQNIVAYIKNEGNTPVTLTMYASNWNPSTAEAYLGLSWNLNEANPISPGQVVQVTFTLTVASNVEGITTFSFDVNIVGTG